MSFYDADGTPMTREAYLAKYGRPAAKPAAKKTSAARSLERRIAALEAGRDDDDCPPCHCDDDVDDDEPEESARRPVGRPESAERRLGRMAIAASRKVAAAAPDADETFRRRQVDMAVRAGRALGLRLEAKDFGAPKKTKRTPAPTAIRSESPDCRPFSIVDGRVVYR